MDMFAETVNTAEQNEWIECLTFLGSCQEHGRLKQLQLHIRQQQEPVRRAATAKMAPLACGMLRLIFIGFLASIYSDDFSRILK
jgi:hypothetical protein